MLGGHRIFTCPGCSLRFVHARPSERMDYDLAYDSPEYQRTQLESLMASADPSAFAGHPTYRPFFREVEKRPGARLLDVGCGLGRFCHGAYSEGWDVTGIDVSDRAIEIARRFARFPVYKSAVEEVLEGGERFDVVTAFEVLEHLSEPVQFLSRVRRLLRSPGQIFCTVPNWDCRAIQTTIKLDWMPPFHLLFFTRSALRYAVQLSGFEDVTTGLIWTDPLPRSALAKVKWLRRRLLRRPRLPLGLWVHARLRA